MSSYGYNNRQDMRYSGGSGGFQQPGNYGAGRSMSRDGRAMSAQEEADAEELRLRREFEELDIDGNGIVDKNEMNEFLRQRNIDEEHRMQIIDVIF